MAVEIRSHRYTAAWGRNKKDAEQRAAMNALSEIQGEPAPPGPETMSKSAGSESENPEGV